MKAPLDDCDLVALVCSRCGNWLCSLLAPSRLPSCRRWRAVPRALRSLIQVRGPIPASQTRIPKPSNCKSLCANSSLRITEARPSGLQPSCTWANRSITTRCNIFLTRKQSFFTRESIRPLIRIMFTMPARIPSLLPARQRRRRGHCRLLDAIHARPFSGIGLSIGRD